MNRPRNSESGYALMLILAMAAILAITLYSEVPRVAFEAQRDKEQLLIDRGGEYQRAVTLFVRKFNRFPSSMQELENTNNQRFLRRKFVDPMTGKDEWRLIHAGPGGVLTDSVTTAKTDQKDPGTAQNSTTDPGAMASSSLNPVSGEGVNLATRRRPNDGSVGAGGDDGATDAQPSNTGIPGYSGPVMVLPDGRVVPATPNGVYTPPAAAGASGRISPMPGMGLPPGAPGATPGQINPGLPPVMPSGVAVQQGIPGMPGAPPPSAAQMINQILTSPRQPGGSNGAIGAAGAPSQLQQAQQRLGQVAQQIQQAQPQQNVIGAGIAGVASKREAEGIKTVNDRSKYNEWEFVYDVTKDATRAGIGGAGAPGASGAPGRGGAQPQGMTPTMPGMGPGGMPTGPGRGGPGR